MMLQTLFKRTDCGLAILLLAFCAFASWRTTLVPSTGAGSQAGPSFLPWIVIVGISLLSLGLLVRGLRRPAPVSTPASRHKITYPTIVLVLFIALMIAYAVAFERIGYLPSTLATFVIGMLLLRERRVVQLLVVPALIVAGVYFGFTYLLDVYLP